MHYTDVTSWYVAGVFSVVSSLLTVYQIRKHLQWNSHRHLRKPIIRIILMVPIYALESWLALRFSGLSMYFDLLRECYEAFVIYSFYQLLTQYLGGEQCIIQILQHKESIKHAPPFCCFKPWSMAENVLISGSAANTPALVSSLANSSASVSEPAAISLPHLVLASDYDPELVHHTASAAPDGSAPSPSHGTGTGVGSPYSPFLLYTQLGTLQYCVLRPSTAFLAFIFQLTGVYGEGEMRADVGYPYLALVVNVSQVWAMYCLVLFYMALKDELHGLKPVPKFIVVKAVVFFTFWQYCLLLLLGKLGVLHDTDQYDKDRLTVALQDFIICVEMLLAAIAHHLAFHYMQFHDPMKPHIVQPMFKAMFQVIDVTDVYVQDVRHIRNKVITHANYEQNNKNKSNSDKPQMGSSEAEVSHSSIKPGRSNNLSEPLINRSDEYAL